MKVTHDSWVGGTQAFRLFDVLNAQQYMDYKNVAVANIRQRLGKQCYSASPHSSKVFLTWVLSNLLSVPMERLLTQTGTATLTALVSLTATPLVFPVHPTRQATTCLLATLPGRYVEEKNSFDRTSLRLNLDHKVTKTLTFGTNFSYSNTLNSAPNSGSLAGSAFNTSGIGRLPIVLPPNVPAYNNDGTYALTGNSLGVGANINPTSLTQAPLSTGGYPNPVVILDKNTFTSESAAIRGAVYANWEIIKGLNARTMFGINNTNF